MGKVSSYPKQMSGIGGIVNAEQDARFGDKVAVALRQHLSARTVMN